MVGQLQRMTGKIQMLALYARYRLLLGSSCETKFLKFIRTLYLFGWGHKHAKSPPLRLCRVQIYCRNKTMNFFWSETNSSQRFILNWEQRKRLSRANCRLILRNPKGTQLNFKPVLNQGLFNMSLCFPFES